MPPLVPCSQCKRHIRVDHDACPFCSSPVAGDFAAGIIPAAKARLDRLAMFTFATAIATACSSGGLVDNPSDAGGATDGGGGSDSGLVDSGRDSGGIQPVYGAPVDASPFDAGNVQPPYGLPPDPDASIQDGGGAVPAYGLPVDAGTD